MTGIFKTKALAYLRTYQDGRNYKGIIRNFRVINKNHKIKKIGWCHTNEKGVINTQTKKIYL